MTTAAHYRDDAVTLHHGDCLDVLAVLRDSSIDAVVTDPPYGISFMGKQWDQPGQFGSTSRRGGGPNHQRGHQELMRWLVRLVTPPGGLVLDPFAGSGTTAEACVLEHRLAIAVEREADYLPLIVARLTKPMAVEFDFTEEVPPRG